MSRDEPLAELEARLYQAEELCPLGTFAWSSARGELEWSAGLYRLTGCDPRAGPPTAGEALELVHPDDRDPARRAARALTASNGPLRQRLRLVRRGGDERMVEVVAEARGEADGVPALVVGACLDVTELGEAQARERRARELERAAFREAPLGIDMVSVEPASFGRILQVNQALARILGRSEEELVGADILELTHPDDREPSRAQLEALERGDHDTYSIEKRYLLPSGEPVWVVVHASLFQPLDDSRSIVLGQVENITARKQTERLQQMQLRVAKTVSAARRVADAMPEVLRAVGESLAWCAGAALTVADDRATARAETTWEREDATRTAGLVRNLARRPVQLRDGAIAEALWDRRPRSLEVERDPLLASLARETEIRSAVLVPVPLDAGPPVTVLVFVDADRIRLDERTSDALTAVAAEVEQLAARERAEAQLAHQALHDPLTGLANRTLLMDRVEHALVRRERTGTGLCLLFIDLDDFKRVNDTLGHPAGDDVLHAVGQRLRWAVRPEDTVARFGGDEFVVLAEGVEGRDGVGELATRLLKSLAAPFKLEEEIFLGASIGAALIGAGEKIDIREAIRRADAGMYRAKLRGRGRWELAPTTHRPASRASVLGMERALRRALDAGNLTIAYQPIVSLDGGGVREVEALARWTDPDLGPISPEVFVSVAEGSELILTLGRYVIEHACREMGGWLESRAIPGLARVSVNLSPRQVGQPELAEVVEASLSDCRLEAKHLALEVTETALINSELATDALAPLREMGVCILVDDFGTGYASLGRLRGFPLDGLKIDRSFVTEMTRRSGDCKLVEAMLEIGRALELDVVAEGIETNDQLELLRELGCVFGQGFLFSRPVPAHELPQVARSLERGG